MATLTTEDRQLRFERGDLSDDQLLDLYEHLLRPRMIEEKMLSLLRQGKISKWFSGIGQEAIAVGVTKALREDEYVLPMHRNLGVFTTRGMPFPKLFAQWQGKATGYSKGRERSFHFGSSEHKVVGMISHLGPQLGIADGIALAHKLRKESRCTAVFTGDGATSEGDFHESLNVAAVWDLPVLFIIENNGYGLSTPNREQFRMDSFVDKAVGYGIEGVQLAGNNILEMYREVARLADSLRERPRPILVECMTFRMRGHEEASGTKYVPQELFEEWGRKDPVANYEQWLLAEGVLSTDERDDLRADIKREIEEGLKEAFAEPEPDQEASEDVSGENGDDKNGADDNADGSEPLPSDEDRVAQAEDRLEQLKAERLRVKQRLVDLESDLEALEQQQQSDLEALAVQHQEEIARLEAGWTGGKTALTAELRPLKADHRNAVRDMRGEYSVRIKASKAEQKERRKALNADLKRLDKAVAQAERELKLLTNRGRLELVLADDELIGTLKERWIAAEVAKRLDYPIFMAVSERGGKDNSGSYVHVVDEAGSLLEFPDGHPQAGQLVVDQDLVNYEVRREDLANAGALPDDRLCVAEAFVRFAQERKLGFWEVN